MTPGVVSSGNFYSHSLQRDVRVHVYMPARPAPPGVRRPLVVVHDGGDYLNRAGMAAILDDLLDRRVMAEAVFAFIEPGNRLAEYGSNPAHSRFLSHELIPVLEANLGLNAGPEGRVLVGASLGAVASLAAAVHSPGFYGGLLLQSPSLLFSTDGVLPTSDPALWPVITLVDDLRRRPRRIVDRISRSFASSEELASANRAMTSTLGHLAAEVETREFVGGHDWPYWHDNVAAGLTSLIPGAALGVPSPRVALGGE